MCLIKPTLYHIVFIIVIGFFLIVPLRVNAQVKSLSSDSKSLLKAQKAITFLYNWQFDSANLYIDELRVNFAQHPACPFFDAMLLFWQNIPKALTDSTYIEHIVLIEQSIAITQEMLEEEDENIEAIFFNLIGRGILMRYYAAVGQKMKAVGEARKVYKYTKKARGYKDDFIEFYFMVGLYDYFREAYPEKYPLYKPFAWFFELGDKEKGLKALEFAANNGVFSVPEALSYLAYIYDKYEKTPSVGIKYLARLGKRYPNNLWFQANYIRILIKMEKYELAKTELHLLHAKVPTGFYSVIANLFEAQISELYFKNPEKAFALYTITEQELAPFQNVYYTEAFWIELYNGLIRHHEKQQEDEIVKAYNRKLAAVGK